MSGDVCFKTDTGYIISCTLVIIYSINQLFSDIMKYKLTQWANPQNRQVVGK